MRHLKHRGKLGMRSAHRDLALRNMTTGLFLHGQIRVTRARARHVSALANHLIAIAQDPDLTTFNKYREIRRHIQDRRAVRRIFALAQSDADRRGSFVRRFLIGTRRGDAAPLALLRLIEPGTEPQKGAPAVETKVEKAPARRGIFGLRRRKTSPPEKEAQEEGTSS